MTWELVVFFSLIMIGVFEIVRPLFHKWVDTLFQPIEANKIAMIDRLWERVDKLEKAQSEANLAKGLRPVR